MSKVAIVVQRYHEDVVGGSEALAWQYATLLKNQYLVDLLTTTAVDYSSWANVLPEGLEIRDGINIHRFSVTIGRSVYWHRLHERLLRDFNSSRQLKWNMALQEEFIRHQGPYSEPLLKFLGEKWIDYKVIIFMTYLYPTTFFGTLQVPKARSLLVPTLHDEPPAYLSAYKYMARRVRALLWLTGAEQRVGFNFWGDLPGRIISMGVDTEPRDPIKLNRPYLLYCGRIDPSKGCGTLINDFIRFKKDHPSGLQLILTGKAEMELPSHPDIEFRGFVSSEEKFKLMAGASLFVMPSPYESFSVVTLEAMAQRTPVLVNGDCQVLADHITQSGGGEIYKDYQSFSEALERLSVHQNGRVEIGNLARAYVVTHYTFDQVQRSLIGEIEATL